MATIIARAHTRTTTIFVMRYSVSSPGSQKTLTTTNTPVVVYVTHAIARRVLFTLTLTRFVHHNRH